MAIISPNYYDRKAISEGALVFQQDGGRANADGNTAVTPVATMTQALALAAAKSPTPSKLVTIWSFSSQNISGNFVIPDNTNIFMPLTKFQGSDATPALTLGTNCRVICDTIENNEISGTALCIENAVLSITTCNAIIAQGTGGIAIDHTGTSESCKVNSENIRGDAACVINTSSNGSNFFAVNFDQLQLLSSTGNAILQNGAQQMSFIGQVITGGGGTSTCVRVTSGFVSGNANGLVNSTGQAVDCDGGSACIEVCSGTGSVVVEAGDTLDIHIEQYDASTITENGTLNGYLGRTATPRYFGNAVPDGAVAGSDTEVQFNDGGVFGADAAFTFDKGSGQLRVTSILDVSDVTSGTVAATNFNILDGTGGKVTLQTAVSVVDYTWIWPAAGPGALSTVKIDGSGNLSYDTTADVSIYTDDGTLTGDRRVEGENGDNLFFTMFDLTSSDYTQAGELILDDNTVIINWKEGDGAGNQTGRKAITFNASSMLVADEIDLQGFIYDADYSGNFVDRSLVDKEYVDSTSIYTADGTLTSDRTVTGNSGNFINFEHFDTTVATFTERGELLVTSALVNLEWDSGDGAGAVTGQKAITFNATAMTVLDSEDSTGLIYAADYSTNFTARSLVDKAYVDGQSHTSIYDSDGTLTGNRIVSLAGFDLAFASSSTDATVLIDAEAGGTDEGRLVLQSGPNNTTLFFRESDDEFGIFHLGTTRFRLQSNGNMVLNENGGDVGIGTDNPQAGLHGVVPSGEILWQDTETDATQKQGRWGVQHFTNSEQPFFGIVHVASTSTNILNLGGGTSLGNAATSIQFFTAANNTTITGTLGMTLDGIGRLGVGGTPLAKVDIFTNTDDAAILRLGTDRHWTFEQEGTGSATALRLRNTLGINKDFFIDTDGSTAWRNTDGTTTFMTMDQGSGNLVMENSILMRGANTSAATSSTSTLGFRKYYSYTGSATTVNWTINTVDMAKADVSHVWELVFKDKAGVASVANPINIIAESGFIDFSGTTQVSITTAGGSISLFCDGTNLYTV